jgi:hypothetical protein
MRLRTFKRNKFWNKATHLAKQFWWVSCVATSKFSYQGMEMIRTWSSKRSLRPVAEALTNIFHVEMLPKICPSKSIPPKELKLPSPTHKLNALKMYCNLSMINTSKKNTFKLLGFSTKGLQNPMSQMTPRKSQKIIPKNDRTLTFESEQSGKMMSKRAKRRPEWKETVWLSTIHQWKTKSSCSTSQSKSTPRTCLKSCRTCLDASRNCLIWRKTFSGIFLRIRDWWGICLWRRRVWQRICCCSRRRKSMTKKAR